MEMNKSDVHKLQFLVGGFSPTQVEKYANRQIGSWNPKNRDEHKKSLSCHHLEILCPNKARKKKTFSIESWLFSDGILILWFIVILILLGSMLPVYT